MPKGWDMAWAMITRTATRALDAPAVPPEHCPGQTFYEPSNQGYEAQVQERVRLWREAQDKVLAEEKQDKKAS